MSKKDESFWKDQISNCNKSGLSRRQYCKNNNLNASTLASWIKKLEIKPKAIKLTIPNVEPINNKEIVINGNYYTIKMPMTVNPELLQIIMKGLK